jgi:hypothetical protein
VKITEKESSLYFNKIISAISSLATNLEHFEVNYVNGMEHNIYLDSGTVKNLLKIFSLCKVVLIRGKFIFDSPFIAINLCMFPRLERFEFDNINETKKIRVNAMDTKLKRMVLSNNVSPLDLGKNLLSLELRNMVLTKDILRILPKNVETLHLQMTIKENFLFDISKYPELKELTLELALETKHKVDLYTSSQHVNLQRLKINEPVYVHVLDTPNLRNMYMNVYEIKQKTIDTIPKSVDGISIQGGVNDKVKFHVNNFKNLGLLHLMNGLHKKIDIVGNVVHTLDGIFLIL